jgi:hypothetical protein
MVGGKMEMALGLAALVAHLHSAPSFPYVVHPCSVRYQEGLEFVGATLPTYTIASGLQDAVRIRHM